MRFIIVFLALLSFALATPIVKIDTNKSDIKDFKLGYFINDSAKLAFKDIKEMEFKEGKNRGTLGAGIKDVWIKIQLFNATNKKQTLFLHQDLAYTFKSMKYFECSKSGKLLKEQSIAPHGPNAQEELNGADAVYEFSLDSNESKTLYIHQITPAYHFYNFYIFSEKESIKYLIYEKVDAVLFVGLLMALALYNFLIFLSSRYKEYFYYTLYLVSSSIWIFYIYGSLAHYVHFYGAIAFRFNFAIMFTPIFLALFVQSIFNTKVKYKKEHIFLNSIIFLFLTNFVYGVFNFPQAVQLLSLTLNYAMFIFLGVAISIYRKGNKIIKIFLFAHSFYLAFNIYALLFYRGIIDSTYISSHGMGLGIAIEALFLAYLVSYKFKVMEEEKEEARLKHIDLNLLATTDSMTKLYNRRYFSEISENIISLSKRRDDDLSLLMIDIDKFKRVNDNYGHQVGDDVIIKLANILRETQRESDIICRYGGEEFVILLPESSLGAAVDVAQKIRKLVESSTIVLASGLELKFTISIGVSYIMLENEPDIEAALKRADDALYHAKKSGRNKVCMQST